MDTSNPEGREGKSAIKALLKLGDGEIISEIWEAGDLSRMGIEALRRQQEGDARAVRSRGSLRLFGNAVQRNRLALAALGRIASSWQITVSNVGASLEGILQSGGRLPKSINERTRLNLVAEPAFGSVVLNIEADQEPLEEVHGEFRASLFGAERPLVDRSIEKLLAILGSPLPEEDQAINEPALVAQLRELGPRTTGSILNFVKALQVTDVDLDVRWIEPGSFSQQSRLTSERANELRTFIEGHELDASEVIIHGRTITVSESERWLIASQGQVFRVRAGRLGTEVRSQITSNTDIVLKALKRSTMRADGEFRDRYDAVEILDGEQPQ